MRKKTGATQHRCGLDPFREGQDETGAPVWRTLYPLLTESCFSNFSDDNLRVLSPLLGPPFHPLGLPISLVGFCFLY